MARWWGARRTGRGAAAVVGGGRSRHGSKTGSCQAWQGGPHLCVRACMCVGLHVCTASGALQVATGRRRLARAADLRPQPTWPRSRLARAADLCAQPTCARSRRACRTLQRSVQPAPVCDQSLLHATAFVVGCTQAQGLLCMPRGILGGTETPGLTFPGKPPETRLNPGETP